MDNFKNYLNYLKEYYNFTEVEIIDKFGTGEKKVYATFSFDLSLTDIRNSHELGLKINSKLKNRADGCNHLQNEKKALESKLEALKQKYDKLLKSHNNMQRLEEKVEQLKQCTKIKL